MRSTVSMRPRQIGQQLSTAMLTSVSTQDVQNCAWPHGTSATAERCATKHTLQQSDVGGASTDGGEDVVADTLALTLLKLAALRFDFYTGMVLLLSVIVLSCNVLSCIFSAPRGSSTQVNARGSAGHVKSELDRMGVRCVVDTV